MLTEKLNEIIARKLNNEATSKDEQILEEWLSRSEENRLIFSLIKKDWQYNNPVYKVVNSAEIKAKIWEDGIGPKRKKPTLKQGMVVPFYLKIAASLLILITTIILVNRDFSSSTIETEWITKDNPAGQKSKIFMPDGSEVWLNSSSKLHYLSDFTDSNRVVLLEGEAFFEVMADSKRPFIVVANHVSTIALGTSFNINAFEENVQISLITGKVKVAEVDSSNVEHEFLILNPGQSAIYENKKFKVTDFDLNEAIGWKDGELYFKDASFDEIIKKLTLWYGVTIQVDEQIDVQKHYTGRFRNESLRNVMENISFSLNFEYEIKDKFVKFYKK